jgi:hypothetical protein
LRSSAWRYGGLVSAEDDAGLPIAYQALVAGTPVHAQDGGRVGTVKQVLAVEEEDVFDGLVIDTDTGSRFIDAGRARLPIRGAGGAWPRPLAPTAAARSVAQGVVPPQGNRVRLRAYVVA